MKTTKFLAVLLLIPSPLAVGYAMLRLMLMLETKDWLPLSVYLITLAFTAFWIWAGSRFTVLNIRKLYSFLLGNSATFLFCLIFIVWGHQAGANALSHWLALLGGIYALPMIGILDWFTSALSSDALITLSAYLLLILTFSAGFFLQTRRKTV